MGAVTQAERDNVARIKAKWEALKDPAPNLSAQAYTTAVALWASLNVDYLITLAERTPR